MKNLAKRSVDSLGRFVIPKDMREVLNIDTDTMLEMFIEDERIIIQRYRESCSLCGAGAQVLQPFYRYKDWLICRQCAVKIKALAEGGESCL